jgi:hypothetical protein
LREFGQFNSLHSLDNNGAASVRHGNVFDNTCHRADFVNVYQKRVSSVSLAFWVATPMGWLLLPYFLGKLYGFVTSHVIGMTVPGYNTVLRKRSKIGNSSGNLLILLSSLHPPWREKRNHGRFIIHELVNEKIVVHIFIVLLFSSQKYKNITHKK